MQIEGLPLDTTPWSLHVFVRHPNLDNEENKKEIEFMKHFFIIIFSSYMDQKCIFL